MNDDIITVAYDDHTEEYGYFRITEGRPALVKPDIDIPPDELTYGISIFPDLQSESFSAVVPEEKEGHTITSVLVLAAPAGVNNRTDYEHITLKRLFIPSTVRYIYIDSAYKCADLLNECKMEISPDNPWFCISENGLYSKDMTELHYIFSPGEYSDGCFEVPAGVKRIKSMAGFALNGLRRLSVPESVAVIGEHAFTHCHNLKEAVICVEEMKYTAFYDCTSLVSVSLPCCTSIGEMAFIGCEKLEKVEFPKAEIIANDAFGFCKALKDVQLPDTLRKLGDNAFAATGIKKLTLPPSVQEIGSFILTDDEPETLTIEFYLKDGTAPRMRNGTPAGIGALLAALSPETNETILEFVILGNVNKIFTEHGFDFTEYDELATQKFNLYNHLIVKIRASQLRLRYLNESEKEKREHFESFIAEAARLIVLDSIIQYPSKTSDDNIMTDIYLDMIPDDRLPLLIDQTAKINKPEITARLLQYQHERREHGKSL